MLRRQEGRRPRKTRPRAPVLLRHRRPGPLQGTPLGGPRRDRGRQPQAPVAGLVDRAAEEAAGKGPAKEEEKRYRTVAMQMPCRRSNFI